MNTVRNEILRPQGERIAAIDILRGIAIFGMILCANIGWQSDLPAWMFHAQVPPPDYVFRPDVPGITWVDLVFPFFLFSMGAAFPFALSKRIASGQPMWKTILGLVKRWAVLACFAIILGNGYRARGSECNPYFVHLFLLLTWGGLFMALTRFRFRKERSNNIANASGIVILAGLAFVMQYVLKVPVSKNYSDIIIMILAYMSVFGGLIWILTRKSAILRWTVFIIIGIIKAICSYAPGVFGFMPDVAASGFGWIFSWEFMQYLMIVIAGSAIGDMILKRKDRFDTEKRRKGDTWIAVLAMFTVIFQLWGLFTRHVTLDLAVTLVSGIAFIALTYGRKALWSDITVIGYLLMLTGIVFDPIDGGITKDHCNLSYLFTTAGMAAVTTGFLVFAERRFGMKARIFSECGQNPMIAYTVTNFLTVPVLSAVGLLGLIDLWAFGSPVMGLVRGFFITGLMMAATVFFTRKKIFWRS